MASSSSAAAPAVDLAALMGTIRELSGAASAAKGSSKAEKKKAAKEAAGPKAGGKPAQGQRQGEGQGKAGGKAGQHFQQAQGKPGQQGHQKQGAAPSKPHEAGWQKDGGFKQQQQHKPTQSAKDALPPTAKKAETESRPAKRPREEEVPAVVASTEQKEQQGENSKQPKPKKKKTKPSTDAPTAASSSATTAADILHTSSATIVADEPSSSLAGSLSAKLAGGKFRLLNEELYTTPGAEALKLMQEPGSWEAYHAGFRAQASGWPTNPLDLIIQKLRKEAKEGDLVVDLGCGDARLARTLSTSGPGKGKDAPAATAGKKGKAKDVGGVTLRVISFDLAVHPSSTGWVTRAQCCDSVPLPGTAEGQGQVVDWVVCCLSLMGTDWVGMVLEAARILRAGGKLQIAEVASRFTALDKFEKLVQACGFKGLSKDTSNTHFVLFEFEKLDAVASGLGRAEALKRSEGVLAPCIYKRR